MEVSKSCIYCGLRETSVTIDQQSLVQNFLRQIGMTGKYFSLPEKVSFCEECNLGMVKVVGLGQQVGEIERDVRSLQRIILKMMQQLQSLQVSYLDEMKRLEGKITAFRRMGQGDEADFIRDVVQKEVIKVINELGTWSNTRFTSAIKPLGQNGQPNPKSESQGGHIGRVTTSLSEKSKDLITSTVTEDISIGPAIRSVDRVKQGPPQTQAEENFILPKDHTPTKAMPNATRKLLKNRKSVVREKTGTPSAKQSFKCHLCCKTFCYQSSIIAHQIVHSDKRPFPCSECGKEFNRRNILKTHKRIHTGKRPYACQVCGVSFRQQHHWKRHVSSFHAKETTTT